MTTHTTVIAEPDDATQMQENDTAGKSGIMLARNSYSWKMPETVR